MAEPTLALTLADLQAEVGLFLGWGRGAGFGEGAWTAQQAASINSCVKSGLRQFYYPPPVDGVGYDWSWLKPVASLSLLSGAQSVTLPDDFGGVEGDITLAASSSRVTGPIPLVGEGQVRQRYAAMPSATGRPLVAAESPVKATTLSTGQRSSLLVFPQADQAYTLNVSYYFAPDALTTLLPYASGGAAHAETLLESCLAVAEQRLDDTSNVHAAKFMERLAASIAIDRRRKPQLLGYNRDGSDGLERRYGRAFGQVGGITYNGTQY